MRSINPATGRVIAVYPRHTPAEAQQAVDACHAAWKEWSGRSPAERAQGLLDVARVLDRRHEEYAALITREMGKPITEARAEAAKCAAVCRFYAERGEAMLAARPVATEAAKSLVVHEPLGLVLAIMPWNFPFWQVMRLAAPALMAGNGFLLKHADNVPGSSLALQALFAEAGLPRGLFASLLLPEDAVEPVLARPEVRVVALTGSARAGRAVAALAGANLKKSILELGGCDPLIVLPDADLKACCAAAARSRMQNAGQTCTAAKRMLVAEPLAREFEARLVALTRRIVRGDPTNPMTQMGPLARADIRENLHGQVEHSLNAGARVVLGGELPEGPGFYYPPTILAGVRPGMAAFEEETFGPLASITTFRDEEEAVALANATAYGLGASLWTRDVARGEALARRIEAGTVMVNAMTRSDFRLPFGGVKDSGWGRELAEYGLLGLSAVKSLWVA
jgi:succinate-semialdehyde dehydrogenase/glutarate-semialdehyde dehydrogenase